MSPPQAFLALWNSISGAEVEAEYEAWHSLEHVPERVGLPGFVEARRYRAWQPAEDRAPRYFTCYRVDDLGAFDTPDYTGIFQQPTPWTAHMRGELRDFFRLTCRLSGSHGQTTAAHLAALHFRGEPAAFAARIDTDLAGRVARGELVCAQWGTAAQTAAIPIANSAPAAMASPPSGSDFVVMLQSQHAEALAQQAAQLVQAMQPAAQAVAPPTLFTLLTVTRRADLIPPPFPGRRQPQRNDLFHAFHPHPNGDTT